MNASRVASTIVVTAAVGGSLFLGDVRLSILVGVIVTAIAALGLDVLVARTGELSLAHAAFLGVGAFTSINVGSRGAPLPVTIVVAVGVTTAASTIAGLPSLRIRGLQVAISTLAFQEFADVFLFPRSDVTAAGRAWARPSFLRSDIRLYLFALALLALVLVIRHRLGVTKAGRAFLAVRDVQDRAVCFGVEPGPSKLLAYALSGAIVGLAGSLFALKASSISAKDPFLLLESLQLVAILVVGGAGSAAGIVTAAVVVKGLPQFASTVPFTHLRADRIVPIGSAALLVVAVVAAPGGIGGLYGVARRRLAEWLDPLARTRPEPRPRIVDPAATGTPQLPAVQRRLSLRMPVPALLDARDVRVEYGGVAALEGASLEVRRGEIVGLIGSNGAGKSTFFNAVSGLAPVTGSIRFRGVELVGRRPSTRSELGVSRTFQDVGLLRSESVVENVLLAQTWLARYSAAIGILALGGSVRAEKELRGRAHVALELFGLEHLVNERVGSLPYGTMRVVEIAAAVAAAPDLLLLDEATAGLGPEESNALGDRFVAVRDELNLTLVLVEHHVPLVARVCDYAYCLEAGALIAEGKPADVTAEPRVVESFLGNPDANSGEGLR